jgi:exonuclease III
VEVGDFNIPLSPIKRSPKQKINEEILELSDTTDQMGLTDVYRIFHPTTAQYTFFSVAHGIFSKIDHILGNKASLSRYKKTNNPMYSIWSQCIKTRTQQQKQQQKTRK